MPQIGVIQPLTLIIQRALLSKQLPLTHQQNLFIRLRHLPIPVFHLETTRMSHCREEKFLIPVSPPRQPQTTPKTPTLLHHLRPIKECQSHSSWLLLLSFWPQPLLRCSFSQSLLFYHQHPITIPVRPSLPYRLRQSQPRHQNSKHRWSLKNTLAASIIRIIGRLMIYGHHHQATIMTSLMGLHIPATITSN